jgi:hypothetical protein
VTFSFSQHALVEMERRRIPRSLVDSVLEYPQQVVSEAKGTKAYQSQHDFGGKMFLVRVLVDEATKPPRVVTVYRTSKIGKYWRHA